MDNRMSELDLLLVYLVTFKIVKLYHINLILYIIGITVNGSINRYSRPGPVIFHLFISLSLVFTFIFRLSSPTPPPPPAPPNLNAKQKRERKKGTEITQNENRTEADRRKKENQQEKKTEIRKGETQNR